MAFRKRKKLGPNSLRDTVAPLADACPTCGASGDEPCKTRTGKATSDHAQRPQ